MTCATRFGSLDEFLEKLKGDTYPEVPEEPHISITRQMVERVAGTRNLAPGAKILDVGCGQGVALELFVQRGFQPVGITLNDTDADVCRGKGFSVYQMDQSFLDFPDAEFDLVWCRHCLEHSIFPFFTLAGFSRVLKPGGQLYVEVPAPDTASRHQANPNHYSVLGKSMWVQLLTRTGFEILDTVDIQFVSGFGPDLYWSFMARKR